MAKMSVVVCDVCESVVQEPQTWAIHAPLGSYLVDLCKRHSDALHDNIKGLLPEAEPAPKPQRARRGFEERIMTMEEIEAQKKGA